MEEKTTSFDAITPPDMGVPNINPDDPGNYLSDASSLDEDSKGKYRSKSCQKRKRDKV